MIEKLQCLFRQRSNSQLGECYGDLQNIPGEYGTYWFAKTYECFEPYWNGKNCRAMGNIFISKTCTSDLKEYIDEQFTKDSELYYYIDYTVGMQIIDRQTVYIHLDGNKKICLLNTELHKDGKKLYAVIVPNTMKMTKQRWMIVGYKDISEAFMTADQLKTTYGIYAADLPKGSKAFHNNWQKQKNRIKVTKDMIHKTFRSKQRMHVIQSKQNLNNLNRAFNQHLDEFSAGAIKIHRHKFAKYAAAALKRVNENNEELICIAHFKFRHNEYHLEKLLPVYLPEYDTFVALSFGCNKQGPRIDGIGLDLTDMKNKASLIQPVGADFWLNPSNNRMIINNLELTNGTPPPKQRKNKNHHRGNNQRQRSQMQQSQFNQMQQQQQWNSNETEHLLYSNNATDNLWNQPISSTPSLQPIPYSQSIPLP